MGATGTNRSHPSSARKSTRDLIGSLRQQAGLPPAEAQLPQPQAHGGTLTPQAAGNSCQTALSSGQPLQPEMLTVTPQAAPSIATLVQQPLSASNPAYDLSVESSEAHTVTEQPQMAMLTTHVTSTGQPVLPQTGLMELVSNPLYARSLEVSRTTSTSPVRLESSAEGKQAEPEAAARLSDSPADSQTPQPILSAQPIFPAQPVLSTDASETRASVLAASEEQQLVFQGSAGLLSNAAEQTDATAMPVDSAHEAAAVQFEPAALHVSKQPMLSSEAAPVAVAAVSDSEGQAADSFAAAAPQQMSDQPILPPADAMPPPATDSTMAMLSDHASEPGVAVVTTDSGNTIAVSDQPILEQNHASEPGVVVSIDTGNTIQESDQPILEKAPQAVTADPLLVTTSQPLLGPVITQAAETAIPLDAMPPASFPAATAFSEQLQGIQQPAQSVERVSVEVEPVMSSQPLLTLEPPSSRASSVIHRMQVTQQARSSETHVDTEWVTGSQPANQAVTSSPQLSTESQGLMLLPPMPALPSVRRSRSDVRFSQQGQPGAVRRSVSILAPTPEMEFAISAPVRPSPVPQLRRSVTSLPASPVPQVPRAISAAPPQAVLQQTPLVMPPAYMQQLPLGPLQEGIFIPAQQQTYTSSMVQLQSPDTFVPSAAPAASQALALPVEVQQVELIDTSSAHQSLEPSAASVGVEQQQVQPALLQESRSLQLSPQQPEVAVATVSSQNAPTHVQSFSPGPPVIRQQTEPAPELIQLLETPSPQQQSAPVFMRNPDAGSPQSLRPYPDPRGAYPSCSPRLVRTNTWSPSPNILQPALPGQAAPEPPVQGPLSMGYQPSWNNPIPPPPSPQAATRTMAPVARPLEQEYAYTSALPTSSNSVQQPFAYEQSMPAPQTDQGLAYERSMLMTSAAAATGYAMSSRAYPLVASPPMASYRQEAYPAVAPASRAMYQQPGPLSGGLARQTSPSHQQLRQQMSMSSRTVPASLAQGSVIQPLQGTVIVGEQSAAVATQPALMQSQGYSIQPISPGQGMVQSARGVKPASLQASPSGQNQYGVPRQAAGGIAKRILQDFGRSSRSSFNAGASVNSSYQSDKSLQQVVQAMLLLSRLGN